MFKLLSWNIQQGGGNRAMKILQNIAALNPQVAILSEFKNNEAGSHLRYGLLKHGYRHQFVTQAGTDENSVILLSKLPCVNALHPHSDKVFGQNILSIKFEMFEVMGVYLPHKKKHTLLEYIHHYASTMVTPMLIAGDFNTGINHIDQAGDSFWYESLFKKLLVSGFVDAFRHFQPDAKDFSWYSHQGNGYRYDHTLVSHDLIPVVKSCSYLHDWRTSGLSDHSPMLLEMA